MKATDCMHEILRFRLKDSQEFYVLDLSSAQYGYHEPIMPYEEYHSKHIVEVHSVHDFGSLREWYMQKHTENGWWFLNASTSTVLKGTILLVENEMDFDLKSVLSGSTENFVRGKEILVAALDLALKEFLKDLRKSAEEEKCTVKELVASRIPPLGKV